MNPEISIVVPTLDNFQDFYLLLNNINQQTLLPKEIVIADSSSSDEIQESITSIDSKVPIIYIRVGRAYRFDRLLRFLSSLKIFWKFFPKFHPGRAFPYEATNAGVKKASSEWVAFLDATTIPKQSWLKDYWNFLQIHQCDVVLGQTKYYAKTAFQKLLRASTYGQKAHETAPGSIIRKTDFLNGHEIAEGVRSGGDVAWKIDIKDSFKYFSPSEHYLKYSSLPKTVLPALKKFFIYQIYGSFLDIQNNVKDLYFGILLLFSIIIIPKWNYIVGWDSSYFIPHITKVFYLSLFLIIFISFAINRVLLRSFKYNTFRANSLKFFSFILVTYSIINWNGVVAKWVEDSIWYIPHITKIFLAIIFAASFVYRGIYFPLKNKIKVSYLFPMNWILVGLLGILLDLIKAPGYLLGSLLTSFVRRKKYNKENFIQ